MMKKSKTKKTEKIQVDFRLSGIQFERFRAAGGNEVLLDELKKEIEAIEASDGSESNEATTKNKNTCIMLEPETVKRLDAACSKLSAKTGSKVFKASFVARVAERISTANAA